MSKNMYCIGKLKDNYSEMVVAENKGNTPAKRVNIVSIKMVREATMLYHIRNIETPKDAVELGRRFLEDCDREQLIVCCFDTKNHPVALNVVSIGSLNSSIVHPREIFKAAILSNAAGIVIFHNQRRPRPI